MTSSQPFIASSPLSTSSASRRRRKSAFTYKQLSQLLQYSPACPLRVIAHIDLDAFYAQCEMVRLSVPPSKPLAVQQWQGLIAINYPARAFGLNRHVTITEAQKLCPELITQHVATWKEGDEKWAYHEDSFKNMATHKVSLDPYRMESRKILGLIKEFLPASPMQRVEKASVDEVFLDLSAQIHGLLMERYPTLRGPPPYDDPTEKLPRPPTTHLNWATDALVDLDSSENEEDDPDWDDVALLIGSEIVRDVRAAIFEKLKYTCSAGLAKNKMLAKLGSGHKKPNSQTVIRNRAVQQFLSGFKFTKIRNLGGKLGDEVVEAFQTDTVSELLQVPLEQVKKKIGDDTGTWLYNVIRGEDTSEVNPRTQIKSMLSAKSFRPSINDFETGVRWLRIFVADIFSRLVEEGVLDNKRRPRTINLHHRQGAQTRSKQAPIPQGKPMSEGMLFDLAKNLLAQVVVDGRAWPCANLSLSVGGFEDGPTGNKGIGGFLVRGEEAKALVGNTSPFHADVDYSNLESSKSAKRKRAETRKADRATKAAKTANASSAPLSERKGVMDFFVRRGSSRDEGDAEAGEDSGDEHGDDELLGLDEGLVQYDQPVDAKAVPTPVENDDHLLNKTDDEPPPSGQIQLPEDHERSEADNEVINPHWSGNPNGSSSVGPPPASRKSGIPAYICSRCNASIPEEQRGEHDDWHFARDLAAEESAHITQQPPFKPPLTKTLKKSNAPPPRERGRPPGSGGVGSAGNDRGQKKLTFGR